jgi:hypothetical protein
MQDFQLRADLQFPISECFSNVGFEVKSKRQQLS